MSSPSGLPWVDTRSYLHALETLLSTSPDTDALVAWRSAKVELAGVMSSSSANARRLLVDLQASLARSSASVSDAAQPLEELRLRLEQIEGKKAALSERVHRMTTERDASAAAMQRLLQATLDLKEEQKRLEAMKKSSSPHLQHQLALYFNVTGLKWDYDSPIVEGFISPADGLPPRALRVDPSALPPSSNQAVALADALWNEISTAHGTVA